MDKKSTKRTLGKCRQVMLKCEWAYIIGISENLISNFLLFLICKIILWLRYELEQIEKQHNNNENRKENDYGRYF